MKYNILNYLIGEGIRSIFKNRKSSIVALITMCAIMFIFGIFFAITQNINNFVNSIKEEQAMQVNINVTANDEEIAKLKEEIEKIEGVATITLRTKEEALDMMKEDFGDAAWSLQQYDDNNVLPNAYIVTVKNLEEMEQIQAQIEKLEGVSSIAEKNQLVKTLISVAKGIKIVTGGLLLILIVIAIVIISNTIKLTVYARRKEISIMKYVGATNNFIRFPFIVEGIIIGLVSGAITILLVGIIYNVLMSKLAGATTLQMIGLRLVSFADMFNLIVIVYLILGIGVGIIGSTMSMKKYLDV